MSQYDPYQPPKFIPPHVDKIDNGASRPSVVTWYQVYCGAMMALYLVIAIGCAALYLYLPTFPNLNNDDRLQLTIQCVIYVFVCVPLTLLFLVGMLAPRKRWGWIYGLVTIGLGLTSCCTWPVTIPLLIYWLKPENKAYFGA